MLIDVRAMVSHRDGPASMSISQARFGTLREDGDAWRDEHDATAPGADAHHRRVRAQMTIEAGDGGWRISSSRGFGASHYDPDIEIWTLHVHSRTRRATRRARVYSERGKVQFHVVDLTAKRLRVRGSLAQLDRLDDDVLHVVIDD